MDRTSSLRLRFKREQFLREWKNKMFLYIGPWEDET